jgi:hypothetical protein
MSDDSERGKDTPPASAGEGEGADSGADPEVQVIHAFDGPQPEREYARGEKFTIPMWEVKSSTDLEAILLGKAANELMASKRESEEHTEVLQRARIVLGWTYFPLLVAQGGLKGGSAAPLELVSGESYAELCIEIAELLCHRLFAEADVLVQVMRKMEKPLEFWNKLTQADKNKLSAIVARLDLEKSGTTPSKADLRKKVFGEDGDPGYATRTLAVLAAYKDLLDEKKGPKGDG